MTLSSQPALGFEELGLTGRRHVQRERALGAEGRALRVAAEGVAGVREVVDHFTRDYLPNTAG